MEDYTLKVDEPIKLSIICPVTKMSGRLQHLRQWLGDTVENDVEVFIVHDIQDDLTGEELVSLLKDINNPRIHLSEGIYSTAGLARNSALENCSGEWICFWDSDDIPHLQNVLKSLDSSLDLIIGNFKTEFSSGRSVTSSHGDGQDLALRKVSFEPGVWRMVFKRHKVEGIKFPSFKIGEDQGFLAQMDWGSLKVKFAPQIFYTYINGNDFQTTSKSNSKVSLIASLEYLSTLVTSQVGSEPFVRNLASRQFFTLIKRGPLSQKILAIKAFSLFMRTPKSTFRQLSSVMFFFEYLTG